MEKNKSVLWQPFPMFWDFCVILMRLLWCLILVGQFLGFSYWFILIAFCLNGFCCHLVVLMDWFWDCLHRCVGNLLSMSKPAAIEFGICCGNLRIYSKLIGKFQVFSKIFQVFTRKFQELIVKLRGFNGNNVGFPWEPPNLKCL